ncbi:hypothetical protein KGP36_08305 [Patescibacteria group bacterium]|nr:hypothetical protein [Patescibacteria group bacterium]
MGPHLDWAKLIVRAFISAVISATLAYVALLFEMSKEYGSIQAATNLLISEVSSLDQNVRSSMKVIYDVKSEADGIQYQQQDIERRLQQVEKDDTDLWKKVKR